MAAGGYQLVLVDLVDSFKSADVGTDGTAEITFDPVADGRYWRVGLINVSCDSTAIPEALVYIGAVAPQYLRSGSNDGNQDTADQNWPLIVPSTRSLIIRWVGADPGSVAIAAIQYELLEKVLNPAGATPLYPYT